MDIITNILLGIGLYLLGCVAVLLLVVAKMLWDRFIEHTEFEISIKECFALASFSWISFLLFMIIFLIYGFCYLSYRFCLKYAFKWFNNLDIWNKRVVWDKYGLRITYYHKQNG